MKKQKNIEQNNVEITPEVQQQQPVVQAPIQVAQQQPQIQNAPPIQPQAVQYAPAPQTTAPCVPPKKKGRKGIVILSILLVISLAASGFFGYMLFLAPDSKNKSAEYTDEYNLFDESGLLKVKTGDKWGFIDATGKIVINPQFDSVGAFGDNDITYVKSGEKYGYINKKGEYVINPQFESASNFFGDLALVKSGEKYGYINKSGKFVINPQFDDAYSFYDDTNDIALVKVDDKYGYINQKGEYIVNPQFVEAYSFSNGLAAVKSGDRWGYINTKGDTVISYQYAEAYSMSDDGYAVVMTTNKNLIIIDKEGKTVTSGEFDYIDSYDNEDICQKDGCFNYASDTYCSTHKEQTSSSSYPYCAYYGCYNRAAVGEYCTDHNYLESYY